MLSERIWQRYYKTFRTSVTAQCPLPPCVFKYNLRLTLFSTVQINTCIAVSWLATLLISSSTTCSLYRSLYWLMHLNKIKWYQNIRSFNVKIKKLNKFSILKPIYAVKLLLASKFVFMWQIVFLYIEFLFKHIDIYH